MPTVHYVVYSYTHLHDDQKYFRAGFHIDMKYLWRMCLKLGRFKACFSNRKLGWRMKAAKVMEEKKNILWDMARMPYGEQKLCDLLTLLFYR